MLWQLKEKSKEKDNKEKEDDKKEEKIALLNIF